MRKFRKFGGIIALCSLLAGIGSAAKAGMVVQRTAAPNHVFSSMRSLSAGTLFVADLGANAVLMYPANVNHPSLLGKITTGISDPAGITVDSHGVLYVANAGNHTITEYRPGKTVPFRTLNNGTAFPKSVAVDSKGNVYVGSAIGNTVGLVEYAAGHTTPFRTLSLTNDHGVPFVGGMVVDSQDNLYIGFFVYKHIPAHVLKFAPGATTGTDLGLQKIEVPLTMGLGLDASGNVYAGNHDFINVYAPGSQSPTRVISSKLVGVLKFFVSPSGALYAPVFPGSTGSTVQEFAPGSAVPMAEITGLGEPVSVTFRAGVP